MLRGQYETCLLPKASLVLAPEHRNENPTPLYFKKNLSYSEKIPYWLCFDCNLSVFYRGGFWHFANFGVQKYRSWLPKKIFFYKILIFDQKCIFFVFCSKNFGKMPWIKYGCLLQRTDVKCSREMLQNLPYFMHKKTHVVFFVFHFVQLYIFT